MVAFFAIQPLSKVTICLSGVAAIGQQVAIKEESRTIAGSPEKRAAAAAAAAEADTIELTFSGWILNYVPVTVTVGQEDTIATVKKALVVQMQKELKANKAVATHFVQARIMKIDNDELFEADTAEQSLARREYLQKFYVMSAAILVAFICLTIVLTHQGIMDDSFLYFWPACFAYFMYQGRCQSRDLAEQLGQLFHEKFWQADRLTLQHSAAVEIVDAKNGAVQSDGENVEWIRDLDDANWVSNEKLKNRDCLMLNVTQKVARTKMATSHEPEDSGKGLSLKSRMQKSVKHAVKQQHAEEQGPSKNSLRLPSDILRALQAYRLLHSNRNHKILQTAYQMSQFDDLLLWSCACADADLADVFWHETKEPIRWALVIGAVTNELAKQTATDPNSPLVQVTERHMEDASLGGGTANKSVPALVQKWKTMSSDYFARADAMIAATANDDDAALLGKAWVSNREVLVKLAFNQEIRRTTASVHGIMLNHPALKKNIRDMWGKYKTRFYLSLLSYMFFLYLHYRVCSDITMQEIDLKTVLFIIWCFSMSIDQCVFGLRIGFVEVQNTWHTCDRVSLTLLQVGIAVRMLSMLDLADGTVVVNYSSRLLSWAYIPLWLRLLGYLSVEESTGVGTVVQIVTEIFSGADNRAFMIILLVVSFSFGMTLSSLHALDEWQHGVDIYEYMGSSETNVTFDLSFMALNLQTPSFIKESTSNGSNGDEVKLDMRIFFYVFLIFANTYLVEGFLVGIISDQFSRREAAEFQSMLSKLTLVNEYSKSEWLPAPFNVVHSLYNLYASSVCETFGILEVDMLKRVVQLQASHETRLPSASSAWMSHPWMIWWRCTVDPAFNLFYRFAFCSAIALVVSVFGPLGTIWFWSEIVDVRVTELEEKDWAVLAEDSLAREELELQLERSRRLEQSARSQIDKRNVKSQDQIMTDMATLTHSVTKLHDRMRRMQRALEESQRGETEASEQSTGEQ
eukprot:SAG22_NODE_1151_length_5350_cov_7.155258_2_plen_971_part_00